jgi:mono/diheme cytochrome c family protein
MLMLVGIGGLGFLVWDHLRPERSPTERGVAIAHELGCWSCHAEAGRPAGSLFAGSRHPEEIARRIRTVEVHPDVRAGAELDDLVAWIAIVQYESDRAAARGPVRGELLEAERLARRRCFSCHGDLGQGGVRNPRSLKGYVPGFFGRDHDRLSWGDDPGVVREWIVDGVPGFFRWGVGPLRPALWFTERAQVKMPAYGRELSERQTDALVRYLSVLRELGPLDAAGVLEYRRRLGLPLGDQI